MIMAKMLPDSTIYCKYYRFYMPLWIKLKQYKYTNDNTADWALKLKNSNVLMKQETQTQRGSAAEHHINYIMEVPYYGARYDY